MYDHDGTAIAVEKGMSVGEISHNFARLRSHHRFLGPQLQSIADSRFSIVRVSEQNPAFAHGYIRSRISPVLSCPRINVAEQNLMRVEDITVGKTANGPEIPERLGNASDKGAMFKMLDDVRVSLSEHIAKVSAGLEIVEGVEAHSWQVTAWFHANS